MKQIYRYTFAPDVGMEHIEAAILLAMHATDALHGETQTLFNVAYFLDDETRVCTIDATGPVASDFNRLFGGFIQLEPVNGSFELELLGDACAA